MFRDLFRGDREFAVIDPRPQTAFADRDQMLCAWRACLDREVALYEQLAGDPAVDYLQV